MDTNILNTLKQAVAAEENGDWLKIVDLCQTGNDCPSGDTTLLSCSVLADWRTGKRQEAIERLAHLVSSTDADKPDKRSKIVISWLAAGMYVELMGWQVRQPAAPTIAGFISPELPETHANHNLESNEIQFLLSSMAAMLSGTVQSEFNKEILTPQSNLLVTLSCHVEKVMTNFRTRKFETLVADYARFVESMFFLHKEGIKADLFEVKGLPGLPGDYWTYSVHAFDASMLLLAASLVLVSGQKNISLPLDKWKQDINTTGMACDTVNNFLAIAAGEKEPKKEIIEERAAKALKELNAGQPDLANLFINHFSLIDALIRSSWQTFASTALEKLMVQGWRYAIENQGHDMTFPKTGKPLIEKAIQTDEHSGMVKAANILLIARHSVNVPLPDSARQMLESLATKEHN